MSILLTNGLPDVYEGIPLSPDYRNMIQVDLILHDTNLSEVERTIAALYQLYPEIPADINKAIEGLVWFFMRGRVQDGDDNRPAKKATKKAFDFEQDANLIYSAFYSAYNISLTTVEFLHWWEFMALFEGLPEDTLMRRVMYWRTADLSKLSKLEKKHVQSMRKIYALKGPEREPMSVEELNQQTKDRVARRFEEAKIAAGKT